MQASQNEESINPSTNVGFVKALCSYYAEFLETDFKTERLPKRRTEYKNNWRTNSPALTLTHQFRNL